jgi:hypothetical protein
MFAVRKSIVCMVPRGTPLRSTRRTAQPRLPSHFILYSVVLVESNVRRSLPEEGFEIVVPGGQPLVNGALQLLNTARGFRRIFRSVMSPNLRSTCLSQITAGERVSIR